MWSDPLGLQRLARAFRQLHTQTVTGAGVWPDMTEHGGERDEWSAIFEQVDATHILVLSLQHLGYVITPQADAGWIGEVGPGPSCLDPGSGGPNNDFTNRNTAS